MSQSDLGKMDVEWFSNLCFKTRVALDYHLSDRCCFHIWVCPTFLADKSSALQATQPFETPSTSCFSPGLVALLVDMTQVAAVGYGQ